MNKKILTASAILAAATMGFALDTWVGSNGDYRVETGFDDGTNTYGYWYDYDDSKETADNGPGTSKITWPVSKGNAYADDAMDPIIDECGGVCGTATMGGPYKYPFVGVGFNIGGENQDGFDISGWGGICITYKSTGIAPALEIAPADEASVTEYNNYKASLKITSSLTTVDLAWSDFKQEANWGKKADQATILAGAAAIKFKIAAADGKSTDFNIAQIGENGKCSGNPIAKSVAASAVKATVANRVLSFSGVKGAATAEVLNLQGQVVLKGSATSSMNLSSLDAGVYMVRVAGQSANFSQKILLK